MNASPMQNVIDAIQESIIVIDLNGRILAHNATLAKRFSASPAQLIGTSVYDLLPPELATQRRKYLEQSIATQSKVCFRDMRHDRWIDNSITPILDNDGKITSLVILGLDVTDQINRENKIQEVQGQLEMLMSNLPGIAYRCKNDPNWTMEFMSNGAYELTGYLADDLFHNLTCSYADLIHEDDRAMVRENTQHALKLKQNFKYTYRIKTAANEEKWVFEQGKGVFDGEGDLVAIEGFITDITAQKQAEFKLNHALEELALTHALLQLKNERLEHLAIHDPLTGLYNRRELDAAIQQEYASLQRLQQPFALMILDIDHFKHVNDTWGHPVGDQVLIGLANLLKQDLRLNDRLIRFGGEEFAIVLSSLKKADAHLLAERIRTRIALTPIQVDVSKDETMDLTIHVSVGLACASTEHSDPQQLIKLADDALYAAKRSGRNKTVVAE